MSREHEEMLDRVRISDRMWSESDLYYRTNRWAEDGRSDMRNSHEETQADIEALADRP
jgi:uncharacterized radical SAM superfamily Fe-S cluster-containing enzyme